MSKLFHRMVLAGLVVVGSVATASTTKAHDYYGRPVYSGCGPRPVPYYSSYPGYSAYRPIVVPPSYFGYGSNYSSFYRGGLTPSWGGYGMGGFPVGSSFGGGGAFPRGGSFGGGPGFSLYIGR